MFNRNDTSPCTPETLQQLIDDARGIPVPRDYFAGKVAGNLRIPNNILTFMRAKGSPSPRPEWHHRYVLILALKTAGTLRLDSSDIHLEPGQALLIHPFQKHRYLKFTTPAVKWLFITFELPKSVDYPELRNRQIWLSNSDLALASDFLAEFRRASRKHLQPTTPLKLALLLEQICSQATPGEIDNQKPDFVAAVLRLATAHMDQSPSIASLAAELKLPVRTLRARFAREAGMSIGRAIRRERLLLAKSLLGNTSDSISSIATRCGFTSIYSFSRAFTHLTGHAPSKVREERR